MSDIFRINESDMPWFEYEPSAGPDGKAQIRVKALTRKVAGVPPVQYVEYAAGYVDPVHEHDTDELFIVVDGELWLDDEMNGPGSVVFIGKHTQYAVRAGPEGTHYFRVVV